MIDVYYWPTPNGHKITMFLEETGLEYRIRPVNINTGDQFEPSFLSIAPNNRIPAIVDDAPADGGSPVSMFESGAILLYLAEKSRRLLPETYRERLDTVQWLFWQMANVGPMFGQNHHFVRYAPEPIDYAIKRYVNETARLYAVLDRRLKQRDFMVGDYSIADIATYPWTVSHERQRQNLDDFPNVRRWFESIRARPATVRAYAVADSMRVDHTISEEAKKILFGQDAETVTSHPSA